MSEPSYAVFVSYASQDAQAAQKICEALRAAGIEVWFDQSELRGGDAWDRRIREQIHHCRLFIAVVSGQTETRDEGYFRREWRLAAERAGDMAEKKAFILPVVVDGTSERGASVPEKFRELQWTRLPNGETPPAFIARVQRLLLPEHATTERAPASAQSGSAGILRPPVRAAGAPQRGLLLAVGVLILGALVCFAIYELAMPKPPVSSAGVAAGTAPAAFSPPPHSIAVLPFINMSGDNDQEYFSEGLTEELLNSLAEIDDLQVAARTSSFAFKGQDVNIGTIARKLNVGAILEGSVRRSGHTVRITAQLINALTGFHLWSKTYDRDLGDVLKLQTEIATAVAEALKVTLLSDVSARIELGGTRNPAAFDAYLHATRAADLGGGRNYLSAAVAYSAAIRLDPNYALAFAGRSFAQSLYASQSATRAELRHTFDKALADARQAIILAPDLAEGHLALAFYLANGALDLKQAGDEFARARALAPGRATVLRISGIYAIMTGRTDAGAADLRRAVTLDPLNATTHHLLGFGLYLAHRYAEASAANAEAISLDPNLLRAYEYSGLTDYQLGNYARALATCEGRPDYWGTQWCLALIYQKLGRRADAEAALAKMQAMQGDTAAYQYSTIYAQWGDAPKALEWLDSAMQLRDPGLTLLNVDPLVDPLRREPRFQAIERELNFPE